MSRQLASSQAKKRGIAEQAVFGDLRITGAELPIRQGIEERGIGQHQDRLMEGADEILAVRRIDRGLAADRGIDLRQQRGRHLHIIEPAPHHRRGETGKIADDAAAERDDKVAALHPRRDDRLADLLEYGKAFRGFPGRHDRAVRRYACFDQRRFGARQHITRHIVVGNDKSLGAGPQRRDPRAERIDDAAPDDDVVAAGAERDFDDSGIGAKRCRHSSSFAPSFAAVGARVLRKSASARIISATIASCGTSRDCTVISACA